MQVLHRCVAVLLLWWLAVAGANATQLQFLGNGSTSINGDLIAINYAQLKNIDTVRSGRIYITVRANLADSPTAPGYTLAGSLLSSVLGPQYDTLGPGESFTGLTGNLKFTPPPAGTYYLYLIAFEYPDLGTIKASARSTSNPKVFTAPAGSSGSNTGGSGSVQELDLVCSCGYTIDDSQVTLTATSVENSLGRTTGTLKLKLWATQTPYSGSGSISGYELAVYPLPVTLGNNISFRDISKTVALQTPPNGTYYITMTLTETSGGQDLVMDHNNFSKTQTFSGTPGGTGGGNGGGGSGDSDTGLDLLCDCSYEVTNNQINLRVNRVDNNTGRNTGTLRLKLWATASPYQGGNISGYQLAEYTFPGTLTDREYFYSIAQTLNYTMPPAGTWYVTLLLTEYAGSDLVMDHVNFDKTITSTGVTTAPAPTRRLDLQCSCSYSVSGSSITLAAANVVNNSTTATSGQLKLKLYATTAPYTGGTINGYKVAEYSYSSVLAPRTFFSNTSRSVTYSPPPAGTYYYTLILTETGTSESIVDYAAFTTPVVVSGGTTAGGSGTGTDPWALDPWNGYYAKELPARTEHFFKITLAEAGTLTLETSGSLDTVGRLFSGSTQIATLDFGGAGNNFRSSLNLAAGTYVLQMYEYLGRNGFYAIQSQFARPATQVTGTGITSGTPTNGSSETGTTVPVISAVVQTGLFETAGVRANGSASSAQFGVGASVDAGFTYSKAAKVGTKTLFSALIRPEASHIGKTGGANLYAVVNVNGKFFMLTVDGRVLPWDGSVATLLPYQTNVALGSEVRFDIINTALPAQADYRFYIGYQASGQPLVYSKDPITISASP